MFINSISKPMGIVADDIQGANPGQTLEQQELYTACTQFEAILIKQLLETMQRSTPMFGKGFGGEYFQGMFQDQLAQEVASNGLGLAQTLYAQMIKTMNVK